MGSTDTRVKVTTSITCVNGRWVHNKIQPVAIGDVLHYLVEAAEADLPKSRTWDIGGPNVLDYGDMMQIYAEVAGLRKRRLVVLPLLTPALASLWVGLVTPIPSGLARPLVESLQSDAVANDHDIDTVIAPPRRAAVLACAAAGAHAGTARNGQICHRPGRATSRSICPYRRGFH